MKHSVNYKRMTQLVEEVFANETDPSQLNLNHEVLNRLQRIHPSTVSEYVDSNGPVAWLLIIPTTFDLMIEFLENKITERELFDLTPLDTKYEALYLCSALVLEEYRRKGIIRRLALEAIKNIKKDHPLTSLFVWVFTDEGAKTSEDLARLTSLPLLKR